MYPVVILVILFGIWFLVLVMITYIIGLAYEAVKVLHKNWQTKKAEREAKRLENPSSELTWIQWVRRIF